mgnify:CR=1 FL=1
MTHKSEIRTLIAVVASLALAGCQLVVSFDRDRLDGGESPMDADVDSGRDTGVPDASDGGDGGVMPECGNSIVEDGEECDDGMDGDDEDGCTDLCEFTCEVDSECEDDDDNACNGSGVCNTDMNRCGIGPALMRGDSCGAGDLVCHMGMCISPVCGNLEVEPGEGCDDGMNGDDSDGCRDDCTRTCTMDSDCDDMDECSGTETCDTSANTCVAGTPLADGTACTSGMPAGTFCFMDACITPVCGNSVTEPGEECDDGMDGDDTDGCTDACEFTCETDAECADATLCNGTETCNLLSNTCEAGTAVDCTGMDSDCTMGVCAAATGLCSAMNINEAGSCDDSDPCTTGETCTTGTCGGGTTTDCSGMDSECTVGVCNSTTGACMAMNSNEGGACDDSDMCTTGSTCTAGTCGGGSAVDCTGLDGDCTMGVCNPTNGMCEAQNANEGGACDDSDACTMGTTCTAGTCGSGSGVCPTGEMCMGAGVCSCGATMGGGSGAAACTGTYPSCGAGMTCECTTGPDSCTNGFVCTTGDCACDSDMDCGMGECIGGVCDCDGMAGAGAACTAGQVCTGTTGPADCSCTGGSCP